MSNFTCPNCGTDIIDSPTGYVTECEHYPKEPVRDMPIDVVRELRADELMRMVMRGELSA